MFFEEIPPAPGTVLEAAAVNLDPLARIRIAVIGYGTMGRAHALNLRRSGLTVSVGARKGSATGALARNEGLPVLPVAEAVANADLVMLMLPDEVVGSVYGTDVAPHLSPEAAIGFAHGFAVAFDQVCPEPGRPCFLVAPKSQGDMLLEAHAAGGGVPGLLAVTDGSPPATWSLAASYGLAVGCLAGGGIVTTFRQECVSDQFGEQAVLCGGVIELLKAAFDIMVEAGYGEANAYFECVHELKLITDLLHRHGLEGLRQRISGTAAYGGMTRGPRVIDARVRDNLREILAEIESGQFAAELLRRHADPEAGIAALARREAAGPLAVAGHRFLHRLHPPADGSQ